MNRGEKLRRLMQLIRMLSGGKEPRVESEAIGIAKSLAKQDQLDLDLPPLVDVILDEGWIDIRAKGIR